MSTEAIEQRQKEPLFAKERVGGRIRELDYAKALCIIGLVFVHVFEELVSDYSALDTATSTVVVEYLGYPIGAPLFMFCMGFGMVLTRHQTVRDFFVRGILLLTYGMLLNLLRIAVPALVSAALFEGTEGLMMFTLMIGSDIMTFAGLAFLLMSLLEKLKLKPVIILVVSVVLSLAGTMLCYVQTGVYVIDQILGHFWATETEFYFPLFNWFIFVAAGRFYGGYYSRLTNKGRWNAIVMPIAGVLAALYYFFGMNESQSIILAFTTDYGFMEMNIVDALGSLSVSIFFIGLLWLVLGRVDIKPFTFISKHINKFYCVSWVIIANVCTFTTAEVIMLESTALACTAAVVIFAVTALLVWLYVKYPPKRWLAFIDSHRKGFYITIWVLTIVFTVIGFVVCNQYGGECPNMFNDYLDL